MVDKVLLQIYMIGKCMIFKKIKIILFQPVNYIYFLIYIEYIYLLIFI